MPRVLPSGIPAGIPDSVGFRNKLILPWNDLIPTCVSRNSADSAEKSRFRKMRPSRNQNTKTECIQAFGCHTHKAQAGVVLWASRAAVVLVQGEASAKVWPVVSRQPSRITLPSLSNAMTAVSVKSTRQHASTKGASPMRDCGKLAMAWPFMLAGGRAVTDASSPLAMECIVVPLVTRTPIVGAVAS